MSRSIPRTFTEIVPGPRTARAGPDTVGATARTSGVRQRRASTCFHPVMERTRWGGRWTSRAWISVPSEGRTRGISSGGRTTTWA